jgi:hypothetical protein
MSELKPRDKTRVKRRDKTKGDKKTKHKKGEKSIKHQATKKRSKQIRISTYCEHIFEVNSSDNSKFGI